MINNFSKLVEYRINLQKSVASIHHQQTHKERGQGENPTYKSLKLNRMPMNRPNQGGKSVSRKTKAK